MKPGHPRIPLARENMSPEEIANAEAHLQECAECDARMEGLSAVFAEADLAAETVLPTPTLRERLLDSIMRAPRLDAYAEDSARLLDITPDRARVYLWRIDDPPRWRPTPWEGVEALWVRGGPSTAGAFTGFIKVKPGSKLPMHDHLGPESGLLLQGRIKDQDGHVYRPGDRVDMAGGSHHELHALPIVDCVLQTNSHRGVRFGEVEFRPEEAS
jgi:hypothetical protein